MPPENQTEQEKFMSDLEQTTEPEKVQEPVEVGADDEEPKNRAERRLRARLQAEREANIAMAERLRTLAETSRARDNSDSSEYLKNIERIYGTDSPEATAATQLLRDALKGVEQTATERALEMFREEQRQEAERLREEERVLDQMVDTIEDTYEVTLSPTQQRNFYTLLEKMSPKDESGNVTAYADPHAVWEVLQERQSRAGSTRAKDLASTSMTPSGASPTSKIQDDAMLKVLRENGIL
jgi:hypothetical protein